jgi:hypothetical protein
MVTQTRDNTFETTVELSLKYQTDSSRTLVSIYQTVRRTTQRGAVLIFTAFNTSNAKDCWRLKDFGWNFCRHSDYPVSGYS